MDRYEFSAEQSALLEHLQVPFAVYQYINRQVVTLILSDGFLDLIGYTDREQAYYDMDHNMYEETHPDDVARITDAAFRFATEGRAYDVLYRMKRNGSEDYHIIHAAGKHIDTPEGVRLAHIWYTDEGIYIPDENGSDPLFARSIRSVLDEQSALKDSYYDHLTGLPGMTYFFEIAESGKNTSQKEGGETALLFLDLCGMKYYNTKFGFAEGDNLIRGFAKLLSETFGSENCCRISADHFAVAAKREGLEEVLRQLFVDSRELNGKNSIPVHVGIYPDQLEAVHVSTAFDRAKIACDALRNTYGSAFNIYQPRLRDDEDHRQYILSHLDQALEEGWVKVYNQPIVRAVTGHVSDEEALARWIDPQWGVLSPAEFIPCLEDAGLIYKLDLYMLDQVLEKIRILESAGLYIVPQSINLSRSDFDACDMVEEIRSRVDAAGISRDKITIEITESVIGRDMDYMKVQVERFKKLGFPVWMDDFGSGYSSLDVLQTIPFDLIKFDMSFMKKLDEGESGKILLTELMKLATALGLDTVCEGVETGEQVRFLQEIGCSKLQGYYYTKPISLENLLERYEKGIQIGFENPEESGYYESIGRINLYDLTAVASEEETEFQNIFNILPMGVIEINKNDQVRYVRSNKNYRKFMKRFFHIDIVRMQENFECVPLGVNPSFDRAMWQCIENGSRVFFDDKTEDGITIRSLIRRIGVNPANENIAMVIAVLSMIEDH